MACGSIALKSDSFMRNSRCADMTRAFAFPYYYFSPYGRLPHAGWMGND